MAFFSKWIKMGVFWTLLPNNLNIPVPNMAYGIDRIEFSNFQLKGLGC